MTFQKKERPSIEYFQIDFLDRLRDLDYLGDKNGEYRNRKYLFPRIFRYFPKREDYDRQVINPLLEKELITAYYDERTRYWGLSYDLTSKGRKYLEDLEIKFDNDLAREILRVIISGKARDYEEIVYALKGRSRLVGEHLSLLIYRRILDTESGYYTLTPESYLTHMEVKNELAEKIEKQVEPENKERFENLLSSLLEED
jgi:hypothetical protein